MSLPLPLGDAFSKIGDYNVWTKFYDINIVDGQVCYTDFDYGMVHIIRSVDCARNGRSQAQESAELLLIPEGAKAWRTSGRGR